MKVICLKEVLSLSVLHRVCLSMSPSWSVSRLQITIFLLLLITDDVMDTKAAKNLTTDKLLDSKSYPNLWCIVTGKLV